MKDYIILKKPDFFNHFINSNSNFTLWPIIWWRKDVNPNSRPQIIGHERKHLWQQFCLALGVAIILSICYRIIHLPLYVIFPVGFILGLLLWIGLYLFVPAFRLHNELEGIVAEIYYGPVNEAEWAIRCYAQDLAGDTYKHLFKTPEEASLAIRKALMEKVKES
jgi:hypothetical protein